MLDFFSMNRSAGLEAALLAAGGAARLADRLGISTQAVSQWDDIPPLRVLDVERLTGVPRQDLRPDLYPRELSEARP